MTTSTPTVITTTATVDESNLTLVAQNLRHKLRNVTDLSEKIEAVKYLWGGDSTNKKLQSFRDKVDSSKETYLSAVSPSEKRQACITFNNVMQASLGDILGNHQDSYMKIVDSTTSYEEKKEKMFGFFGSLNRHSMPFSPSFVKQQPAPSLQTTITTSSSTTTTADESQLAHIAEDLHHELRNVTDLSEKIEAVKYLWGGDSTNKKLQSFRDKMDSSKETYLSAASPSEKRQACITFNNVMQASLGDILGEFHQRYMEIVNSNIPYDEKKEKISGFFGWLHRISDMVG